MLTNKITLVTGAGRGIEKEIAKAPVRDGTTVIVNYNGSVAKAERTVAGIVMVGGKAEAVQYDVSDFGKSGELMDYIIKTHGKLNILVNNVGTMRGRLFMGMSEADFDAVINISLKGVFNCMQHVTHQMIKQKGGRIINITSMVGMVGDAGQVNYATSKVGITGVTKSAVRRVASRGITVSAIVPESIVTEMTDVLSDAVGDVMKQQIPVRTSGETSDVAETAAFLAPEKVRYITDQVVSVDGGMVM